MAQKKRRPTAREKRSGFIINFLTLIVLILLVFEGKSMISLFSHVDIQARIRKEEEEVFASAGLLAMEAETETEDDFYSTSPSSDKPFIPSPGDAEEEDESEVETKAEDTTEIETEEPSSTLIQDNSDSVGIPEGCEEYISCIVPAQEAPVADSYFSDAVFVGDSRLEGFRNFSGISGTNFATAVGMQLENFYDEPQISTSKGSVLPLVALKSMNFTKIYMCIGTNELGAYDMEAVCENYKQVVEDIKRLSSSTKPVVYIFGVFYVDEYLTVTDYVNNTNVDRVNEQILKMCAENGYHYINLNEALSDGNSMIIGASDDGIHLNAEYCEKWLEYTKTHYIP